MHIVNFIREKILGHHVDQKYKGDRQWAVYSIKNDSACDFVLEQLHAVLEDFHILIVDAIESIRDLDRNYGFFYIGHGDEDCVFKSEGFNVGVENCLCGVDDILRWRCGPLVWWACYSAEWLQAAKRKDWLGFRDFFGYDLRNKYEWAWWCECIREILVAVLTVSDDDDNSEHIRQVARKEYETALLAFTKGGDRSYVSLLLCKALYEDITWGDAFGA